MPVPVMPLVSAGTSAAQLISSAVKKRQANRATPPLEDVEQRRVLEGLRRKRGQLERGGGAFYKLGRQQIGSQLAGTQRNILRASGGNVGLGMSGLAMAQRSAGQATNKLLAEQQREAGYYTQLAGQVQNQMAQRRLALQMSDRLQKLRESAELQQGGMANLLGTVAMNAPINSGVQTGVGSQGSSAFQQIVDSIRKTRQSPGVSTISEDVYDYTDPDMRDRNLSVLKRGVPGRRNLRESYL